MSALNLTQVAGERLDIKDPLKKQPLAITVVKRSDLEVIGHQRKPRPAHLKALTASIERLGFITALVTVERDGKYLVIDGQHRLTAGTELGIKEFPVVVVPDRLARRMMSLNVEQTLNIRERSAVSLSIYQDLSAEDPNRLENDGEVVDIIESPHLVTLGLAYDRNGRLAGSAFELLLKKCDGFLDQPLHSAFETRERRAELVLEAANRVKDVEDALKERGQWHSMARYQIISYANPTKRARKPSDFDKTFTKFLSTLEDLVTSPQKVLSEKTSDE